MPKISRNKYYVAILVYYSVLTFCSLQVPFIFDNVGLVSRLATYYYETDLYTLILPNQWDSGHPPFYAFGMALAWKVFGKSLIVSHLVVWPFLILLGIVYYQLARYFLPPKYVPYAIGLLFLEPTLLAQTVLGGFDILLVATHLLAIYAILKEKRWVLSGTYLVLGLLSYRGMIAIFILGICDVLLLLFRYFEQEEKILNREVLGNFFKTIVTKILLAYLPVCLVLGSWFTYHYQEAGFLFFNHKASWATTYQLVDWKGFLWNNAIIGWRYLDFGRVTIWIVAIYLTWRWIKQPRNWTQQQKELFIFCIIGAICYLPFVAYRTIPIVHRYFLVYFLLFGVWTISFFPLLKTVKTQKKWILVVYISLLSGHFWVYPNPIAKGWDSFLAFLPYFELRTKMTHYLEEQQIPVSLIGTESPADVYEKFTYLTEDTTRWQNQELKSFNKNAYIIQSNIMNNYTDTELDSLKNYWILEKEFRSWQVYMRLYKNPKNTTQQ